MKRYWAAIAVATTFGLSGCENATTAETNDAPSAAVEAASDTTDASAPESAPAPSVVEASAPLAPASGAPKFAALYPGAAIDGAPLLADGPAGPGGMVSFHTDASPEDVVAFYRSRAEGAGLNTIMGMSQGEARAYGAAGEGPHGPSVRVVASPDENGRTIVQLAWSAGG